MSAPIGMVPPVGAGIMEPSLAVLRPVELQVPTLQPTAQADPAGFGSLVTQGIDQVNQQLLAGQVDLQRLAVGNVANLHDVMIRMEEGRLSFQLLMQVRNRVLEAYQDVMKMQV